MKRLAILLLCLCMVLCAAGCGGDSKKTDADAEDGDYIISKGDYTAGVKVKKLENTTIRVSASEPYDIDTLALRDIPGAPSNAYQIALGWKETYGVDIQYDVMTTSDYVAAHAADNMPDILTFSAAVPFEVYQDLSKLIDFDDPLYHTEYNDLIEWTGGYNYVIGTKRLQRKYIIFNQTRFEEEGIDNPLELYKKGEWTFTKFKEVCKAMTNADQNKYGFTGNEVTVEIIPYSIIKWDENGKLSLAGDYNDFIRCSTELYNLYKIDKVGRKGNEMSNWRDEFPKGNDAIVIGNEHEFAEACRKSKLAGGNDFGVAPMFTWDITGETEPKYSTYSMSMSIAAKSKNLEGALQYLKMYAQLNDQICERMGLFGTAEKWLTDEEREVLKEQEEMEIIILPYRYAAGSFDYIKQQLHPITSSDLSVSARLNSILPTIQQGIDEYNSRK